MITAAASSAGSSADSTILGFVLLAFMIGAYWVPTIIAYFRHLPNVAQVALLNFFLGWTGIGWVVALIWAAKPKAVTASA
jgi:Superinfection immunity protein